MHVLELLQILGSRELDNVVHNGMRGVQVVYLIRFMFGDKLLIDFEDLGHLLSKLVIPNFVLGHGRGVILLAGQLP